MRKFGIAISTIAMLAILLAVYDSKAASDIDAKVAQLNIDTATLDDVIRIFGEPIKYAWGNQTFNRKELPVTAYMLWYPDNFHVLMERNSVSELRFQSEALGYIWNGGIRIGSSLDEIFEVVGLPAETIVGQSLPGVATDSVLYKDIDGKKGYCYYCRRDKAVRFFFDNYKVCAIYVTRYSDSSGSGSEPISDINAKVAQVDINTATLDDVIRIFGEPEKYHWGKETFTKDNLRRVYIAKYPGDFGVVMKSDRVSELRFESPVSRYVFREKIRIGSSLEEVLEVVGQPTETIVGQPNRWEDGVLYKDIDGRKGYCYYRPAGQEVRFFFGNYKVASLYVTSSHYGKGSSPESFKTFWAIQSIEQFDDVRWRDISKLDLSDKPSHAETLWFNQKTVWPLQAKMPSDFTPEGFLKKAMNPGLGISKLHQQGITGKGINVAIIDQPLYLDHPEFAGKIVKYHDVGCDSKSSMHGPAVTSLLVGTNCGTAPGARVYYVAAPSWTKDAAYQAEGLYWIIEQNKRLPEAKKIRVVSVSAAPSGPGSPFEKHNKMWDEACRRAEAAGILVLDCTAHHGFIGACWYDVSDPENVSKCTPGFRGRGGWRRPGCILVPTSPRTTAEEYNKGEFGYQYCGRGGLSWAIPYCAGVLALGWQVNPEASFEQMRALLFESAYVKETGEKIINPGEFIPLVRKSRVTLKTKEGKQ